MPPLHAGPPSLFFFREAGRMVRPLHVAAGPEVRLLLETNRLARVCRALSGPLLQLRRPLALLNLASWQQADVVAAHALRQLALLRQQRAPVRVASMRLKSLRAPRLERDLLRLVPRPPEANVALDVQSLVYKDRGQWILAVGVCQM